MVKRKKGRTRRAKLIRDLDTLAAKVCKLRDLLVCQRCRKRIRDPRGCHAHHIQSRSRLSLRWSLVNLVTLCYGCHRYVHGHPQQTVEWFAATFPDRDSILAEETQKPITTIRISTLEEWRDQLRQVLRDAGA
jgi:5-methylcytosine-specific restriction endonuclease McrA